LSEPRLRPTHSMSNTHSNKDKRRSSSMHSRPNQSTHIMLSSPARQLSTHNMLSSPNRQRGPRNMLSYPSRQHSTHNTLSNPGEPHGTPNMRSKPGRPDPHGSGSRHSAVMATAGVAFRSIVSVPTLAGSTGSTSIVPLWSPGIRASSTAVIGSDSMTRGPQVGTTPTTFMLTTLAAGTTCTTRCIPEFGSQSMCFDKATAEAYR
jgi:hypothetical protein